MQDFSALSSAVIPIVLEVSDYIKSSFGGLHQSDIQQKDLNSLVTTVDKTAEQKLVQQLRLLLPGSDFITEENMAERSDSPYQWIIDPLDGTTNFVYSIPHFSISVALRYQGQLQIGIVQHVMMDETYHAIRDDGAFLNQKMIRCAQRTELNEAILVTGFPYNVELRSPAYLRLLYEFIQKSRGIRRFGSAALDLAYVAAGRFDGYFERYLNPWDIAAGALLVQEAGGLVSDFLGGEQWASGESIMVANSDIHKQMLETIQKAELQGPIS